MADVSSPHYEARASQLSGSACRALISEVDYGSPAWEAGLEPGMTLVAVEGHPLTDVIEWRWWSDGFDVEVTLDDGEVAYLERGLGQDWGVTFDDVIFDGLRTCRNSCVFCFMRMLPHGMRPTLYIRDDDYRLSFLQGNFVTLTNVTDAEAERIVEYDLEPLHVSLHAVSPEVRSKLMGANAQRGMDVLEHLLDAGIHVHVQLVVVPGVNDGEELARTIEWVEAHPQVLTCGIVPLGYTKHQTRFSSSFSDDPSLAAATIDLVRDLTAGPGEEFASPRYHISDEFYLDAHRPFPPASHYGDYPQFQDGIGMMRSFIDDWEASGELVEETARELSGKPAPTVVVGEGFERVLAPLVEASPLSSLVRILPVKNRFFGGNVDVTCLLTGADVIPALLAARPEGPVVMARESYNQDMALLDDVTLSELEERAGCEIRLCTYSARELLASLA